MSPEARTTRIVFQQRLAELRAQVPGVQFAAIASEDGLLAATDAQALPSPIDRRAAVMASLAAVADTASRELGAGPLRALRIGTEAGVVLLRPFGRPRRRLLLVQLGPDADAQRAAGAMHTLALELERRLAPAADPARAA
jgi:predicted regulator of Ras-like GTPase activity (Roadblock/LC7/MglB family)